MRELLSSKDYRALSILETLTKGDISLTSLMRLTEVSLKTIHSDIEYINELVNPIKLNKNEDGKLTLHIPKNFTINYIYPKILESSLEFRVLEKIFFEETYTIEKLSNELFVSPSSLRRSILRMNKILDKLSIKISLSPLRISGKESAVRNFYIQFFLEKFPNGIYPFNNFQKKVLDSLLNYYIKKNTIDINYTDLEKLRVSTIISLIRMQHENFIDFNPDKTKLIDFTLDSNFLIRSSFKSIFKVELNEHTIFNMFSFLFTGKFFFSYDQLLLSTQTNIEVNRIKNNFEFIIDMISNKFELHCKNKESLLTDLCTAYFLNYGPPFILYDFYTEFINYFLSTKPELITYIKSQFEKSFTSQPLESYHLNNYIYILVSHWENLYFYMEKGTLSVGIFYNTDYEQSLMIKNMIDFHFSNQVETNIMNSIDIHYILDSFPNYDLVITNISGLPNKNVLCFSSFPTKRDWDNIHIYIQNYNSQQ